MRNQYNLKIDNVDEYIDDINKDYDDILDGKRPKNGIVFNMAKTVKEMLDMNGMDEISILKATIRSYHDTLCEMLQEQSNISTV